MIDAMETERPWLFIMPIRCSCAMRKTFWEILHGALLWDIGVWVDVGVSVAVFHATI